ncbi:MAG: alternate F1F0 ATPase, F1 subunit alpha [Spirochaetota bacterium]
MEHRNEGDRLPGALEGPLEESVGAFRGARRSSGPSMEVREVGTVTWVGQGVARVEGLPGVRFEELIRFPGNVMGMAFNLDPDEVDVVLLDKGERLRAGDEVERTGRILDVPVGESVLGRVIGPLGRPLDGGGGLERTERRPVERPAPGITDRLPVTRPLQTGITSVDALIPIGRGQRELILGDRQTGKTAIALDTIINQRDSGVYCVYCVVGQRGSMVARLVQELRRHQMMDRCAVVVATGEDAPGLNYVAPYAATAMAEFFMDRGEDVLVVYDDLTRHARSYRELSLLLRRPPAREAYPGDIFYIHSRLLERATHLNRELGGGSMTALPIIETQAQNVSAYIPTNLISITDGQIYLSPELFGEGILPAVDVGRSVSRVGGRTQLAAYREVAGDLRLSYSQFEELETFARFGTRLDEETRKSLERGRRVREALKQSQYRPIPVPEQVAVLLAVTEGLFDGYSLEFVPELKDRVRRVMRERFPDLAAGILEGEPLAGEQRERMVTAMREELRSGNSSEGG